MPSERTRVPSSGCLGGDGLVKVVPGVEICVLGWESGCSGCKSLDRAAASFVVVLCAAECCFADGARRKGGDTLCVLWGREVWCALISSSFVSTTCAAWVAKRSARKRATLCRVVYGVCSRTFGLCLLGGNLKTARLQSATPGHCRVFEKGEREGRGLCFPNSGFPVRIALLASYQAERRETSTVGPPSQTSIIFGDLWLGGTRGKLPKHEQ